MPTPKEILRILLIPINMAPQHVNQNTINKFNNIVKILNPDGDNPQLTAEYLLPHMNDERRQAIQQLNALSEQEVKFILSAQSLSIELQKLEDAKQRTYEALGALQKNTVWIRAKNAVKENMVSTASVVLAIGIIVLFSIGLSAAALGGLFFVILGALLFVVSVANITMSFVFNHQYKQSKLETCIEWEKSRQDRIDALQTKIDRPIERVQQPFYPGVFSAPVDRSNRNSPAVEQNDDALVEDDVSRPAPANTA